MKTSITKVFFIDQPIDKVWKSLSDPREMVICLPGAAITEIIDDRNFKGEVTMKFGPIKTQYGGEIAIEELDDVSHSILLKGRGIDARGKGSADMTMRGNLAEKEGGTEVSFKMEVTIIGMLAQFGSRLINDVTDSVLDQFVDNFKANLSGEEVDNELQAGSFVGSLVKKKIGNIFGDKKES